MSNVIKLWHGGRFKEGVLEVGKSKTGRAEYGPGIYTSTDVGTAEKYAKGGGRIAFIELSSEINWMEKSYLKCDDIMHFIRNVPRIKNRKLIIDDILMCINRSAKDDNTIFASVLTNLCHYHQALVGEPVREIARFYRENNIHASLVTHGLEDWVIVLDPSKIIKARIMPQKIIDLEYPRNFGKIEEQLHRISENKSLKIQSTIDKHSNNMKF